MSLIIKINERLKNFLDSYREVSGKDELYLVRKNDKDFHYYDIVSEESFTNNPDDTAHIKYNTKTSEWRQIEPPLDDEMKQLIRDFIDKYTTSLNIKDEFYNKEELYKIVEDEYVKLTYDNNLDLLNDMYKTIIKYFKDRKIQLKLTNNFINDIKQHLCYSSIDTINDINATDMSGKTCIFFKLLCTDYNGKELSRLYYRTDYKSVEEAFIVFVIERDLISANYREKQELYGFDPNLMRIVFSMVQMTNSGFKFNPENEKVLDTSTIN